MALHTARKRVISPTIRYYMPSGNTIKLNKMLHIDDNGCECLICSGSHDLYAEIQSYRGSCDLQMLLRNIDPNSIANAVSSFSVDDLMNSGIVDYTQMPATLGGMFNLVQKGENIFNGLPEAVRAEFNYSVKNFVSKFGTPEFSDIMNKYMTPKPTPELTPKPTPEPTPKPTPEPTPKGDE